MGKLIVLAGLFLLLLLVISLVKRIAGGGRSRVSSNRWKPNNSANVNNWLNNPLNPTNFRSVNNPANPNSRMNPANPMSPFNLNNPANPNSPLNPNNPNNPSSLRNPNHPLNPNNPKSGRLRQASIASTPNFGNVEKGYPNEYSKVLRSCAHVGRRTARPATDYRK